MPDILSAKNEDTVQVQPSAPIDLAKFPDASAMTSYTEVLEKCIASFGSQQPEVSFFIRLLSNELFGIVHYKSDACTHEDTPCERCGVTLEECQCFSRNQSCILSCEQSFSRKNR